MTTEAQRDSEAQPALPGPEPKPLEVRDALEIQEAPGAWFASVGLPAIEVDKCPDPSCEVCRPGLSTAA